VVFSRTGLQWRTAPPVPSIPCNVTSITQDGAATVSWQHPGDNGTASYTITAYANGTTPGPFAQVPAPASYGQVTGLANSTPYAFTVKAANRGGFSAESPVSGQNTPLANLLFGDDFGGSVIDPAWVIPARDGDQSNSETQFYVPQRAALDGASNLVLTLLNQPVQAPGYADANPPGYGGPLVTRQYQSARAEMAWPGAAAPAYPAANGFTQRGFNWLYGQCQVRAKVANLPGAGWPAIWQLGSGCQQTDPLNPDNVGSCSWPNPGSEEIDIAEFRNGTITAYNAYTQYAAGNSGTTSISVSSADTAYHTYEADWSPGTINWLLDGATVGNSPWTTSVAATAQFLLLQVAARGTITAFTTPQMTVDWVRVFHN
jgi:hypothetical protein